MHAAQVGVPADAVDPSVPRPPLPAQTPKHTPTRQPPI
jgi:hypothetical protein